MGFHMYPIIIYNTVHTVMESTLFTAFEPGVFSKHTITIRYIEAHWLRLSLIGICSIDPTLLWDLVLAVQSYSSYFVRIMIRPPVPLPLEVIRERGLPHMSADTGIRNPGNPTNRFIDSLGTKRKVNWDSPVVRRTWIIRDTNPEWVSPQFNRTPPRGGSYLPAAKKCKTEHDSERSQSSGSKSSSQSTGSKVMTLDDRIKRLLGGA